MQGKLEVLQKHYEDLRKVGVDDNFEANWKEEVVSTLETCSCASIRNVQAECTHISCSDHFLIWIEIGQGD